MKKYDTISYGTTTMNIYGIYDMNGGAYESVMGVFSGLLGLSGFDTLPDKKYYDEFTFSDNISCFYGNLEKVNGTSNMNGVFKELMGANTATLWYNAKGISVCGREPWFVMGGFIGNYMSMGSGVFASDRSYGIATESQSFRAIMTIE